MSGERENCLYHVSPTAGLRELQPSVTQYFGKPRQVCLTASLPMALMYGVKHFEYTYGYTRSGQIYYEEYFPDALAEIYRGKKASLYRCAFRPDMTATAIPNEYVTPRAVTVLEETLIPDVYEALLEQERLGRLKIVRYSEMTAESLAWVEAAETVTILEHGLLHEDGAFARYMREKYPRSWEQAQAREKEREAQP